MSDSGPFMMDHDPGRARIERLAADLVKAAGALARRQFDGKPTIDNSGIPGASIIDRTIMSIALQSIWNACAEQEMMTFNALDGVAHAMATTLAQMPAPGARAAALLLTNNTAGYEQRTRAALLRPDGPGH